jgi:hypothetical protein
MSFKSELRKLEQQAGRDTIAPPLGRRAAKESEPKMSKFGGSIRTTSIATGAGNHRACAPESGAGRLAGVPSSSKAASTASGMQPPPAARPTTRGAGREEFAVGRPMKPTKLETLRK